SQSTRKLQRPPSSLTKSLHSFRQPAGPTAESPGQLLHSVGDSQHEVITAMTQWTRREGKSSIGVVDAQIDSQPLLRALRALRFRKRSQEGTFLNKHTTTNYRRHPITHRRNGGCCRQQSPLQMQPRPATDVHAQGRNSE